MLKNITSKVLNFYIAPVRHLISNADDYLGKANQVKDGLLSFGYDMKVAQQEFTQLADEVYQKASAEISHIDKNTSEGEIESSAIESISKAKDLLTNAAVELAKGAILLSFLPIKDRIQAATNTGGNVIEGEVVK